MSKKTHIVFIINPKSGTGRKDTLPDQIDAILDHERFTHELRWTEYRGHAAEITRQCVADGVDVVVAVGGDGIPRQPWASFLVVQATAWHATCVSPWISTRPSESSIIAR